MKEGTRSRILGAALACFRERGYDGTTIAQIARRAGVSPATLYLHFPGKRELFDSLHRPDLDFPDPEAEARRREVLRAALDVFSAKGYAGATMEDVAAAVGVSKAALYGYFHGKEELFTAVIENAPGFSVLETLAGGRTGNGGGRAGGPGYEGPPEVVLERVARSYLRMFHDPARLNLVRIILAEGGRNPAVCAAFFTAAVNRGSALLAEYLDRLGFGPRDGLRRPVQAFMGMLFSWVVMHRVLAPAGRHPAGGGAPPQKAEEEMAEEEKAEEEMAELAVSLFLYGLEGRRRRP